MNVYTYSCIYIYTHINLNIYIYIYISTDLPIHPCVGFLLREESLGRHGVTLKMELPVFDPDPAAPEIEDFEVGFLV